MLGGEGEVLGVQAAVWHKDSSVRRRAGGGKRLKGKQRIQQDKVAAWSQLVGIFLLNAPPARHRTSLPTTFPTKMFNKSILAIR